MICGVPLHPYSFYCKLQPYQGWPRSKLPYGVTRPQWVNKKFTRWELQKIAPKKFTKGPAYGDKSTFVHGIEYVYNIWYIRGPSQ